MTAKSLACLVLPAALFAAGCSARSVVIRRPESAAVNRAVTSLWSGEIRRVARTGDWILTRSYSIQGDLITALTRGESISHASLYDARSGTVIEALAPEVREVPLEHLLNRNELVIVVRPSGLTSAQRAEAVERAREYVGTPFDWGGLVGVGRAERFYCSELVYWASGIQEATPPRIVSPAELMNYGEVVYYSGKRGDSRVQNAAVASRRLLRARRASHRGAARVAAR